MFRKLFYFGDFYFHFHRRWKYSFSHDHPVEPMDDHEQKKKIEIEKMWVKSF